MPNVPTRALLVGALLAAAARAQAGPTAAQVWNEVFSADEQRILYALRANPAYDAALRSGLARVAAAPAGQAEEEKRRFQVEWLGRIQRFASTYRPGQGQGGVKPTAAQARAQVPWLAAIDAKDWGGQLTPQLISRMDPYELGYDIAHLRSLRPDDQQAVVDKLGWAKTLHYSAGSVVDEMVKTGRQDMGQVLAGLSQDTSTRLASARQQLEAAQRLLAAAPGPADASAEHGGSQVFDGARPAAGHAPAPPAGTDVVDARGQTPPASGAGALKPAPGDAPSAPAAGPTPPGGGLDLDDIPPPRAPEAGEKTYAAKARSGGGFFSNAGHLLGSPVGKGGLGGGALGGLLGFFLGGPIGAAIGFLVGAAAGAGVMMHSGRSET